MGIERLGIWSLVLATTSFVTLANQGFSTSIVKFVAKYAARERSDEASVLVQTALISIGVALGIALIALYPAARWILAFVLPRADLSEAFAILPYAVISLWVNVIAGILQAALTGHELIDQCNYIDLSGSVFYLLLAFALVPSHGLLGLGYAQTAQAAACFLALLLLLKRRIPQFPFIPRRWNHRLFREMAGYGLQFQLITASQAIREPVTKALLAKFGGPAMTGLYDMASRLVVTLRESLVQANGVLIPTVSSLQEREPSAIPGIYEKSYRLLFFLGIPSFALVVIVSPVVSAIWLGRYEPLFVEFVAVLAAGWLVNVLSNPAYVVNLGTGTLPWISIGCALTAVLNAALGVAGGVRFGPLAVVAASALSLAVGYAIVVAAYHIENRVSFRALVPEHSAGIVLTSALALMVFLPVLTAGTFSPFSARMTLGVAGALLTMAVPVWIHPMRKRLFNWALGTTSVEARSFSSAKTSGSASLGFSPGNPE